MRHTLLPWVLLILASTAFAGCLGGDGDTPTVAGGPAAPEATPTAESGSVKGQVMSADLNELPDVSIFLTKGSDIVQDTRTDAQGRFTFNGVAPDDYRLQASRALYHDTHQLVKVEAGKVEEVSIMLQPLSADDLKEPYMVPDEWKGFLSCGVAVEVPDVVSGSLALCSVPGIVDPAIADPNEDFFREVNVSAGIKTLLVGMRWTPTGGIVSSDLQLLVENLGAGGADVEGDDVTYADVTGPSPLIVRIDNDDIEDEAHQWDNITTSRALQFRVFAGGTNVVYQQGFELYWQAYYHEEAPETAHPLPDA